MTGVRLLLTALTLASGLLSFISYTIFIKYLGATGPVDALFYAASVPLSVAGTCSGVLLYMLPPHLTQLSRRLQDNAVRIIAGLVLMLTICAVIAGFVMLAGQLVLLLTGFTLTAGVLIMTALVNCLRQARGAYLVQGSTGLITSLGLLLGALAAILWQTEWLLLVGQFTGAVTSLIFTMRGLALHRIRRVWLELSLGIRALRPLRPHAMSIAMGTTAFTFFQPIDAALCSLLDSGSVTIMAYATRVAVATGTAISFGAFAVAAYTSRDALQSHGRAGLQTLAFREVARILAFGLAVWATYALGADRLLVQMLQSSSLPAEDVRRLTDVLFWILLGVGPMATVPYFFRVFYSMELYSIPARLGICIAPGYALLAWLGLSHLGLLALAYSYALVWWAGLVFCIASLSNLPKSKQFETR